MCPAVLLIYFISDAAILLMSLALMTQFSMPYNRAEKASVFYNFILVFFRVFCGLNTLSITPVISRIHGVPKDPSYKNQSVRISTIRT
jgi:hypothetical protein